MLILFSPSPVLWNARQQEDVAHDRLMSRVSRSTRLKADIVEEGGGGVLAIWSTFDATHDVVVEN